MKKMKTICSAIVAFTALALAGCDLELPDSAKVLYNTNSAITWDTGVASADEWGTDLVVGFSPMYGTFSYSTYEDDTAKIEDASVTGAGAWWTDRVDSLSTDLADGETVSLNITCTEGSTIAFCVHVYNSTGWWWYNPGDGNFWGDDSLNAVYEKTYKMSASRTLKENVPYVFTITRNGTELSWSFKTSADSGDEEEEDD
ncbi:MAG: hypothetical protein II821_02815 [Treponema sp.]|nr:hypothetical protein [Treponema sp.]